eukprot:TRINITY_DN3874_c0_g2_i1.p1 TRINITY_DN3874_c0_g2~~TRINITY_DN3874_c0_g2_i1.p1  ORF type:complete len:812 (-),score=201.75 TRINITY_DN3874_c0_g2_i1:120-2555(-)
MVKVIKKQSQAAAGLPQQQLPQQHQAGATVPQKRPAETSFQGQGPQKVARPGPAAAQAQSDVACILAAAAAAAQHAQGGALGPNAPPPPPPQVMALLSQLGVLPAPGSAPPAPGAPPSPGLQSLLAAAVARGNQAALGAPSGQVATAAGLIPPGSAGSVDLLAHLAASARINAAMSAAHAPSQEQAPAPVPVAEAFDKDALQMLAKRAAEAPEEIEPLPAPPPPVEAAAPPPPPPQVAPSPPQAEAQSPVQSSAAAATASEAAADQKAPESTTAEVAAPSAEDAEAAAEAAAARKETLSSLMSMVQSNVARGKSSTDMNKDVGAAGTLHQAFTIGASGSRGVGAANAAGGGTSNAFETVCQKIESAGSGCSSDERKELEQEILELLQRLEPHKVSDLVAKISGSEGIRTSLFFDVLTRTLQPSISRFGSPPLARLLSALSSWAMAINSRESESNKLRLSDDARTFFTSSVSELSARLMDIAPKDLAQISVAVSNVGLAEERFFLSIARTATARLERFATEDFLNLCIAFDKANFVHVPLFEALGKQLKSQVSQVSAKDLAKGLSSLATSCVREHELGRAIGEHFKNGPQDGLSPDEFCSLAWAFCSLGFYHDEMFRAVFKALEETPTMPGDALCQLYEIHMSLKAFRQDLYSKYELEDEAVQSLKTHYKKQRGGRLREEKLEKTTEKVCKDISDSLQKVVSGSISKQHQIELGFTVDVAVTEKKGTSPTVLIEVDGPHSLMKLLDHSGPSTSQISRVRGPVQLKRYLLQKQGFRIAVVPEEVWKVLSDGREKREFLRELLRTAGVKKSKLL